MRFESVPLLLVAAVLIVTGFVGSKRTVWDRREDQAGLFDLDGARKQVLHPNIEPTKAKWRSLALAPPEAKPLKHLEGVQISPDKEVNGTTSVYHGQTGFSNCSTRSLSEN